MEQKLIKEYLLRFILGSFIFEFLIVFLTVVIITEYQENDLWLNLAMLAILASLVTLVTLIELPYIKDIKLVRNKPLPIFEGKVIGYKRIRTGGEPESTIFNPIVENLETHEKIELRVEGTERDKTYQFCYLKHTKLAVFEKYGA